MSRRIDIIYLCADELHVALWIDGTKRAVLTQDEWHALSKEIVHAHAYDPRTWLQRLLHRLACPQATRFHATEYVPRTYLRDYRPCSCGAQIRPPDWVRDDQPWHCPVCQRPLPPLR